MYITFIQSLKNTHKKTIRLNVMNFHSNQVQVDANSKFNGTAKTEE